MPSDEVILEALVELLNLKDPQIRAEVHSKLCERFLKEAEELLTKGDHVQASEEAWGQLHRALRP